MKPRPAILAGHLTSHRGRRRPRCDRTRQPIQTDIEANISNLPANLCCTWTARDGTPVSIRPIRPEDAGIGRAFVHRPSPRSRHFRYLSGLNELPPAPLEHFTHIEFPRRMAVIATFGEGAGEQQIGVARYAADNSHDSAEFAIVVDDEWQGKGLGRVLFEHLFSVARATGFRCIDGIVLRENSNMLRFASELGFEVQADNEDCPHRDYRTPTGLRLQVCSRIALNFWLSGLSNKPRRKFCRYFNPGIL